MKGSLNILSALATELVEKKNDFQDPRSLINYVKSEASDILNSVLEKMPEAQGTLTRAYFFYFENSKPKIFKAEYIDTANFVFEEKELFNDEIHTTNDISSETAIVQNSFPELREKWSLAQSKYGADSVESALIIASTLAHLNDPPVIYVGGHLYLYKLTPNTFTKEIIYDFDPHIVKNTITLKEAAMLANGG